MYMSLPRHLIYPGKICQTVNKGLTVKVESVGTKYAVVLSEDGTRYKTPFGNLDFAAPGTAFSPTIDMPSATQLKVGVPVRFKKTALKKPDSNLYVIISKRGEVYKLVRFGGGLQYSNVSASHLELVDFNVNTEEEV